MPREGGAVQNTALSIRARLARWGWPPDEIEALAGRLARRDADDDRRLCAECRHYLPGRCGNHRLAGLQAEVGRDLAATPQRCPGFRPRSGEL